MSKYFKTAGETPAFPLAKTQRTGYRMRTNTKGINPRTRSGCFQFHSIRQVALREAHAHQAEENKALSCEVIFIENLIRVLKIFKVAQVRFSSKKERYTSIILTICGLVRLRKGCLILEVVKDDYDEETIAVTKNHSFGTN